MVLVGIPLDTLITLLVMAFGLPVGFVIVWWLFWVPKPAKTCCAAKLHKDDVNIEATDTGRLIFWRGKAEGPGLFRGKKGGFFSKEEMLSMLHRSSQEWVTKRFSADKIGMFLSYSGQGVTGNPKHVAMMEANRLLHADKDQRDLADVDLSILPANIRKDLEGCNINLLTLQGEGQEATWKEESKQALLLDPRIFYDANTKLVGADLLQYIQDKSYREGWQDCDAPLLKRALPLLFAMGLILLALALALTGGPAMPA